MYKCGWQGCEKAYGTLNHLNAHVTMQSHGQKRTPEGMFIYICQQLIIGSLVEIFGDMRVIFIGVGARSCWG